METQDLYTRNSPRRSRNSYVSGSGESYQDVYNPPGGNHYESPDKAVDHKRSGVGSLFFICSGCKEHNNSPQKYDCANDEENRNDIIYQSFSASYYRINLCR